MKNFESTILEPMPTESYEALGRWLCWHFYRDSTEIIKIPHVEAIFEETIWKFSAWGELLSGAFRENGTSVRRGGKAKKLGIITRPEVESIDGVGMVRAGEVLLYVEIAEKFTAALKNELIFD